MIIAFYVDGKYRNSREQEVVPDYLDKVVLASTTYRVDGITWTPDASSHVRVDLFKSAADYPEPRESWGTSIRRLVGG